MGTSWTLAHPALILAAPVALLALAAAARRSAARLSRARRILSGLVRGAAILLLTLAMGGPTATRRRDQPYLTIFLGDVSESVPRDAWTTALPELRRAWDREIQAGNRCALVAFAGAAEVMVPPGDLPLPADLTRLAHRSAAERLAAAGEASAGELSALRAWTDRIGARTTDLSVGLSAARALFQENATHRIVLLTDGRTALRPAREIDLPAGTCLVRLEDAARQDVAVVDVAAPTGVRAGEPFDLRVTLAAAAPGPLSVRVSIDDGRAPEMEQAFHAPSAGRHVLVLKNLQQQRSFTPGLRRLHVLAQAADDADPRNNMGAAAVTVSGKPRVLLVEGTAAEPLARLLQAQDLELVREPGSRLAERSSFEEFVAVILSGVPREALGADAVGALSGYVSGTGGGLWVVGSPSLAGERGYARSEFEKLLPVAFTETAPSPSAPKGEPVAKPDPPRPPPPAEDPNAGPPQRVVSPTLAILFVVDKSGSMAGENIELLKKACIGSARNLTPRDHVGVLAFDVKPRWVLPFTEADRPKFIEDSVRRLYADGGTHIHPAMVEALRAFKSDARARRSAVKHAILLSDGDTVPADFETVTRQMAEEGITVTTVCIGCAPKFDAPLMSRIADWGRGRFIFTDSFQRVPNIFAQETRQVLGQVPRDEKPPDPVPPSTRPDPPSLPAPAPLPAPAGGSEAAPIAVVVRDPHEVLQRVAVGSLPRLRGILSSTIRPGKVEVPLATGDGRAVLALWRVGLGKVAVWTSDLSGAWGGEWIAWKDAGKIFAQLVRHVYSAAPDAELAGRASVRTHGAEAVLRIEAGPPEERLRVLENAGESLRELALRPAPEGGWTLRIPLERSGEMQRLLLDRGDGKQLVLGVLRAYEAEFAPADPEHNLFANSGTAFGWEEVGKRLGAARLPGEHREDFTFWAILAVLLLLPIDVALRRFSA